MPDWEMVMFNIIATTNGPIIQHGDKTFTLRDQQDLIALAEDHPEFFQQMNAHIVQHLVDMMGIFIDAFSHRFASQKPQVIAYLDAAEQFLTWEEIVWRNYCESLRHMGEPGTSNG